MKKYTGPFVGGSKQGEIKITKNILIKILGKPHKTKVCDKIKYKWIFELSNKKVVSIYPWKYSPKKDEEFLFSIGANDKKSAEYLKDFIDTRNIYFTTRTQIN